MNQIIETLEEITDATGLDFDRIIKSSARQQGTAGLISAKQVSAYDIRKAQQDLVFDTPDKDFEKAWRRLEQLTLQQQVYKSLQSEQTTNQLYRRDEQLYGRLGWDALQMTAGYVQERAKALSEIAALDLADANQVILDGHANEYQLSAEISDELALITSLVEVSEDPTLVMVEPPEVPQYVDAVHGDPAEPDAPSREGYETEYAQIRQFATADTRTKYLLAARFGWNFRPIADMADYANRCQNIDHGSTYLAGAYRVSWDETVRG